MAMPSESLFSTPLISPLSMTTSTSEEDRESTSTSEAPSSRPFSTMYPLSSSRLFSSISLASYPCPPKVIPPARNLMLGPPSEMKAS